MKHAMEKPMLLALVGAAFALGACGDDEEETADTGTTQTEQTDTAAEQTGTATQQEVSGPSPGKVVKTFYEGIDDNPTAACKTLSAAGLAGSGGQKGCEKTFRESNKSVQSVDIGAVKVTGDTATVRFKVNPGKRGVATLVNEAGRWKINDFK